MVGQPRSTQRLPAPIPTDEDLALRAFLRDFSRRRPRWGWRRAATAARVVNNKRIHRLWRLEGLSVPYRKRKRPLRGIGVAVGAMCPIRPNVIWALDFQFDQTSDGRNLKLLNVIDEYSRECLAIDVDRSIDADGRLTREVDPLANEAATLASRLRLPEIMAMVERADDATLPLARRAHELATRHIVGQAIAEPTEAVLRILGQRPAAGDRPSYSVPDSSLHGSWDRAVGAVALYQSAHPTSPFPSANPVDELIGLRALSPDPESWDRVDASVRHYVEVATNVVNEQSVDLQIDIGL